MLQQNNDDRRLTVGAIHELPCMIGRFVNRPYFRLLPFLFFLD